MLITLCYMILNPHEEAGARVTVFSTKHTKSFEVEPCYCLNFDVVQNKSLPAIPCACC